MYKVIVTLDNHKVIHSPTEKTEVNQKLTLSLENELPKYLGRLRAYLEDRLLNLSKKIYYLSLKDRARGKSKSNVLDTSD